MKKREVKCIQTKAQGDREERPPGDCSSNKPRSARRCNQRACEARRDHMRGSVIKAQQNQNYVQSKFMKMLTLKVILSLKVYYYTRPPLLIRRNII